MSKWFAANKLVLNLDKKNTIKFVTNKVFAVLGCDALLIGS
jgi:CTP:molybdopterin cytidylyltransferase MocA